MVKRIICGMSTAHMYILIKYKLDPDRSSVNAYDAASHPPKDTFLMCRELSVRRGVPVRRGTTLLHAKTILPLGVCE